MGITEQLFKQLGIKKKSNVLSPERARRAQRILDANRLTVNADDRTQERFLQILGSDANEQSSEQVYKQVTENDLMKMKPYELADIMVKNDPTIDKIVDDFIINALVKFNYDCEDPRGNDVIHDFIELLNHKRNPFDMSLVKLFTSIILRGEMFAEIVFDDNLNPSNFFVMDPRYAVFEKQAHETDGPVWVLGQYRGSKFTPIESDTVFFTSINPLLEDPRGRSMIGSAFPSIISSTLMLQDLRTYIKNQAWVQRYISINILALKEAGYSEDEIETIVRNDKELIEGNWKDLDIDEIPVGTGEIEWKQFGSESAAGRLNFVDTVDRVYDRKSIRGGKTTPSAMGSNEYVAESSAEEQSVQYDIRLSSHQETVEKFITRPLTQVIRSQGIYGNVNVSIKRVNSRERLRESEVYQQIMLGIKQAREAGIPTMQAIKLYEELTGHIFKEETKEELEEVIEKEMEREMEMEKERRNANRSQSSV